MMCLGLVFNLALLLADVQRLALQNLVHRSRCKLACNICRKAPEDSDFLLQEVAECVWCVGSTTPLSPQPLAAELHSHTHTQEWKWSNKGRYRQTKRPTDLPTAVLTNMLHIWRINGRTHTHSRSQSCRKLRHHRENVTRVTEQVKYIICDL